SSDVRTAMEVVRACLGRLEAIERIILGFDQDDRAVLVGHATGLGTEGTWRCFQDESTARGKPFDLGLTRTPRGEGPQIREDGGDVGYFIGDDTVVLVSKDWIAEAEARLRGEGTAAIDGSLAVVAGRVQPDAPQGVVGRITGPAEIGLVGRPRAGIDDVSVSLGLPGSDLELRIEADAGEKADATRVRDELQRQLREFEGVLPLMGFPGTVAPKLAFETEGDLVSLAFVLTEAELRGLREG